MGFSTMLLMIFAVFFWMFRVTLALVSQAGFDLIGIVPANLTIEIILIFFTLVCLILIAKGKLIGPILYVLSYGYYFGLDLFSRLSTIGQAGMALEDITNIVASALGILLSVLLLIDAITIKAKKGKTKNQQADWFFDNEQFDRKFDERADRNEYKF